MRIIFAVDGDKTSPAIVVDWPVVPRVGEAVLFSAGKYSGKSLVVANVEYSPLMSFVKDSGGECHDGLLVLVTLKISTEEFAKTDREPSDSDLAKLAPDWKYAPPYARWYAIGKDGSASWYESQPFANEDSGSWLCSMDMTVRIYYTGKIELPVGVDWRKCRWARP